MKRIPNLSLPNSIIVRSTDIIENRNRDTDRHADRYGRNISDIEETGMSCEFHKAEVLILIILNRGMHRMVWLKRKNPYGKTIGISYVRFV